MGCVCDSHGKVIDPDWPLFRKQFPLFGDVNQYPDDLLQMYWDEVICFVSNEDYGIIRGSCRLYLLNLFVAHMLQMTKNTASGKVGSIITGSTVDKVSVQRAAPPTPDMFSYWLAQTPFGQQALAMLELRSVGGDYIGGLPEAAAFRRLGGGFFPRIY